MANRIKSAAGKLGGRARIRLHGNPGTIEGRRLGGLRSLKTHSKKATGFNVLRKVQYPPRSNDLAELLGVLAGDGHLGLYQVSVTTNSKTDIEHALFVKSLLQNLFSLPVSVTKRKGVNAVTVLMSSRNACDHLERHGMVRGNKLASHIDAPEWVKCNLNYSKSFLRGLIDTDGCAYFDRHSIKGRDYASRCIAFTNASVPLLAFVEDTFRRLGYCPTRFGRNIRLRRKGDVLDYIKTVGFSNPKHTKRIKV